MTKYYVSTPPAETAYLVGMEMRGSRPLLSIDESLSELKRLAETAGMEVVGSTHQTVNQIDSATWIGKGKVEEIVEIIEQTETQVVIFDDELSPRHQRELEKRFGQDIKVLDRSALILDIFAQHARTHEGTLQVELAQYEYRLPRLTRQWTHLARQAGGGGSRSGNGGVGLRGPGETQLEVDRREIGRKITKLKADLENVRKHRQQHRNKRSKAGIPVVALVGYTNAGKSTLLNALTNANVYAADQLFATLDPTTRRIDLNSGREILLSDTVGFIQKLPTTLIAAFRATLEEITQANLLIHVVDASHPSVMQHIEAVEDTLAEIDIPPIPRILVWNKIDLTENPENKIYSESLSDIYSDQITVSAQTGSGLEQLLECVEDALTRNMTTSTLLIPYDRGDIVSILHDEGMVMDQTHTEDGVRITVQLPGKLGNQLTPYKVEPDV